MSFSNYVAVKTEDPESLFDGLNPMGFHKTSWQDGMLAVATSNSLFITLPLNGWTLFTGDVDAIFEKILLKTSSETDPMPLAIPADYGYRRTVEAVVCMSKRYPSVQYFFIHEGYQYLYALAEDGKLLRLYSLNLIHGEYLEFGDPSPLEVRYGFTFNRELYEQRDPDTTTDDGMRSLAAQWGINPEDLEAKYWPIRDEFGGWLYAGESEQKRSTEDWLINWRKGFEEALGQESESHKKK